jgi:signal transduction histidine kinase
MKKPFLSRTMISLPLAILAAIMLAAINEVGFQESDRAAAQIREAQLMRNTVGDVLQSAASAETEHRGYLLTGEQSHLAAYDKAMTNLEASLQGLEQLKSELGARPAEAAEIEELRQMVVSEKEALGRAVLMRRENQPDHWKALLAGLQAEPIDNIRAQAGQLAAKSREMTEESLRKIEDALWLSRLGIGAMTFSGLLAFIVYLRQTSVLVNNIQRRKNSLQRERERLSKQVTERTARLAELATHLQDVREDERGHLARELHDELGALLTSAKLDVARINARLGAKLPEVNERLDHLTATLNSGIALKRRIVEDLRPSSLTHLGLVASLEILAREFAELSGLKIETSLQPVELDATTELTVYRLVQESLTNISKYAHAQHVKVRLIKGQHLAIVEVGDDGQGFDCNQVTPGSHGLSGMRHRVEAAGGSLKVISAPGQGTLISADLPIQH